MTFAQSKIGDPLPASLIGRLLYYANTKPNDDAIVSPNLKISYLQLSQLVHSQVDLLNKQGITFDSVIGIKCSNEIKHLILTLATISMGTTSFTVPTHEDNEIQNALSKRCSATNILDTSNAISLQQKQHGSSLDLLTDTSTAILLFSTSGTTGKAKLVMHQDIDLVEQAHRHVNSDSERFLCLASIEHNFVKRHRMYCIAMGATNVFIDNHSIDLIAECLSLGVNVIHVSAFQAQELLAVPNVSNLSHVRLKLGGSHVGSSLRKQLRKKITQNLQAGYGTTETGAIAFSNASDINDEDSVGRVLPGIEIKTVSPDRAALLNGKHGEIAIRCAGMFRGYYENNELTSSRLVDNWFYTGDIGYVDDQHRIHLCGRSDDMFTFNSINIYPQEIETQIHQYPGIADAAILPKASSIHGNIPIALVTYNKDVKPDLPALEKFMHKKLGVRCPRQFTLVDEIPRNATGKILRQEALMLCKKGDGIRKNIIKILGEHASNNLRSSKISAFIKGDTDIKLRKLKLDSLARMDLLVALEVNYDTIITPQQLTRFRYLGNLVARVLSTQAQAEEMDVQHDSNRGAYQLTHNFNSQPHIVKLFRRVFNYCHTVAHLNKTLSTLENRVTPHEIDNLYQSYQSNQLISSDAQKKFHEAFSQWIRTNKKIMDKTGKEKPETFYCKRIAPAVRYYKSNDTSKVKTLLVFFTAAGARNMGMPNSIFLQHIDAKRNDVLIISEPLNEKYLRGIPHIGKNISEVIEWIAKLQLIKEYREIRTMGCSAGSYPAILAGYKLGAEVAVSLGGRFHTKSHPLKSLKRLLSTFQTVRKKSCSSVLMVFAIDEKRDRFYAKIIALFTTGRLMEVSFSDEKIGHLFLDQLAARGELISFFDQTILLNPTEHHNSNQYLNQSLCFTRNKPPSYD